MIDIARFHRTIWAVNTMNLQRTTSTIALFGGRLKPVPRGVVYLCLAIITLTAAVTAWVHGFTGADWVNYFRPAIMEMFSGRSPYNIPGFYTPPWALIPLAPFALFSPSIGGVTLSMLTALSIMHVCWRLGAKPWLIVLVLTVPQAFDTYGNVNLEWLALLGMVMPPQISLIFLTIKPQVGAGVAIAILLEAWQCGGIREVARITWPVTALMLLSFVPYGFWPVHMLNAPALGWNQAFWPQSLLVALPLLVYALRRKDRCLALFATPLLSPYLSNVTWITLPVALSSRSAEAVALIAAMWFIHFSPLLVAW